MAAWLSREGRVARGDVINYGPGGGKSQFWIEFSRLSAVPAVLKVCRFRWMLFAILNCDIWNCCVEIIRVDVECDSVKIVFSSSGSTLLENYLLFYSGSVEVTVSFYDCLVWKRLSTFVQLLCGNCNALFKKVQMDKNDFQVYVLLLCPSNANTNIFSYFTLVFLLLIWNIIIKSH